MKNKKLIVINVLFLTAFLLIVGFGKQKVEMKETEPEMVNRTEKSSASVSSIASSEPVIEPIDLQYRVDNKEEWMKKKQSTFVYEEEVESEVIEEVEAVEASEDNSSLSTYGNSHVADPSEGSNSTFSNGTTNDTSIDNSPLNDSDTEKTPEEEKPEEEVTEDSEGSKEPEPVVPPTEPTEPEDPPEKPTEPEDPPKEPIEPENPPKEPTEPSKDK